MYNHNKAQQSKNRVHIYWDILYETNTGTAVQQTWMVPFVYRYFSYLKSPCIYQIACFIIVLKQIILLCPFNYNGLK